MQDESGIAWLKYKDHRTVGLLLGAVPAELEKKMSSASN